MKESDITQPVIEKCKEIAKHWRMEIYEGCWVLHGGLVKLVFLKRGQFIYIITGEEKLMVVDGDVTPIPSISDCLRKLDSVGMIVYNSGQWEQGIDHHDLPDVWMLVIRKRYGNKSSEIEIKSKSLHEALLSALLEAVE